MKEEIPFVLLGPRLATKFLQFQPKKMNIKFRVYRIILNNL